MQHSAEISYALFEKEREHIKRKLCDEPWVRVDEYNNDKAEESISWYCGLIKNRNVQKALKDINWELHPGTGFPGCSISDSGNKRIVKYDRFCLVDAEPLIFDRDYSGFRASHTEVSEEFRFFHNLYYDETKNEYVKFDASGDEIPVIRFNNHAIEIRLKEIREFLAIKNMHLAIFFAHCRYTNVDLNKIPKECREELYTDKRTIYRFGINENSFAIDGYSTLSYLRGKKFVTPYPKSKINFWPYEKKKTQNYEEFIIGETSDGDSISYTCDPSKLADYFGANSNAPNYLTPVHFRRDVLQKYYNKSEIFSVEDALLRCGSKWILHIDNNHEDIVIVYLGDLGRDLPAKERAYWKTFNISPEGKLSRTKFMRDFMAEFSDPEGKDLIFKQEYELLNQKWKEKYSWSLFRELKPDDEHYFKNLRVLLNNSQSEFDSQILALAKVQIDSLNESNLVKNISNIPDDAGGITKLEGFLKENGFVDYKDGIETLRLIQGLRSTGVAHLKGSKYKNLAEKLNLSKKELRPMFSELLEQATDFLRIMQQNLDKLFPQLK